MLDAENPYSMAGITMTEIDALRLAIQSMLAEQSKLVSDATLIQALNPREAERLMNKHADLEQAIRLVANLIVKMDQQ